MPKLRAQAVLAALCTSALATTAAAVTPRLVHARVETSSLTGALTDAVQSAAVASREVTWIGWSAPALPDRDGDCCGWGSRCTARLEGGTRRGETRGEAARPAVAHLEGVRDLFVFVRAEAGALDRVAFFDGGCPIDADGRPVLWLEGVKPAESVSFLEGLASNTAARRSLWDAALAALAQHDDASADAALARLVAPERPLALRKQAAFWMGVSRGRPGFLALRRLAREDPSTALREHVTFALTQSREGEATDVLIEMARRDASPRVRGQALFWLAQRAGQRAVASIEQAIADDPETEVKTKAVFALSQLPPDEGVPLLIKTARENANPRVRKQAFFWLGQSKDPRALAFFEDVLKD
jgi:HEAT repeats